ncbi:MAG: hypothetical protein HZA63_14275 [Rhodocyclales bacterium]|nr:hypothetical protein [Rhodocyclales bacterium]
MMQAFQLPAFADAIPCQLLPSSANACTALLARRLYEAQIIPHDAPPRAAHEPLQTAKKHLMRWIEQQVAGMQCLTLHVRLVMGKADEEFTGRPSGQGMVTSLWSSECEPFTAHSADRGHPFQADRGQRSGRSRTPWVRCLSDGPDGRATVRHQRGTLSAISAERGQPGYPRGALAPGG